MKSIHFSPLLCLILLAPSSGYAAGSLLRIACEAGNKGAEVTVNGKFKGQCPLDLQVPEGLVKLKVVQAVDDLEERIYEKEIRIGDGVLMKVDVALGTEHLHLTEKGGEYLRKHLAAKERENEQRATSGDMKAMMVVAASYDYKRNAEQRVFWVRKAADAGHPEAMTLLAELYEEGKDVPKSLEQSKAWLLRAAEAGDGSAMVKVVAGYSFGKYGLEKDGAKADSWEGKKHKTSLKKAEAGDPESMESVGRDYRAGSGVEKNPNKAYEWFQRAAVTYRKLADAGDGWAMYRLSSATIDENGERMSKERRQFWEKLAVEHSGTSQNLKEIRAFLRRTRNPAR